MQSLELERDAICKDSEIYANEGYKTIINARALYFVTTLTQT